MIGRKLGRHIIIGRNLGKYVIIGRNYVII